MEVRAAVARNAGEAFTLESLTLSDIRDDEVLIRIVATGLCHTDIAVRDQMLPMPLPAVLGHEGAGVVEAVGKDVTDFAMGDPVILGFNACRACPQCLAGNPAYCVEFGPQNFGGGRTDGTSCLHDGDLPVSSNFFGQSSFATHAIATPRNLVKVPADAPLALLGPLGCGIMTGAGCVLNVFAMKPGETLLVTGGGPVGLSAVMAAVVAGAGKIIVSDPLPSRRKWALELGATHVIDPAEGDLTAQVRTLMPEGVNYALDTSGVSAVIEASAGALGAMGRLAMVGVPRHAEAAISLNILHLMSLGIQVCGVTEGNADPRTFLPELIELHRQGRFPFDRIIKSYPLDEINRAVDDQHAGVCVKAVLTM